MKHSRRHSVITGISFALVCVYLPVLASPMRELPRHITNSLGMVLVLIIPGDFMMGSPETEKGHWKAEKQHRVKLTKPFYIQNTEVAVGQFWKFKEVENLSRLSWPLRII